MSVRSLEVGNCIEKKKETRDPLEKNVSYSHDFKEEEADHISIESETNERVLKQPPDGGRAWLVLFGCFCVSWQKRK